MFRLSFHFIKCCASYKILENNIKYLCIREFKGRALMICSSHNLKNYNLSSSSLHIEFNRFFSCDNQKRIESGNQHNQTNTSNKSLKNDRSSSIDTESKYENNDETLYDFIDYEEISGGDNDTLNKFKLLLLEVDVMRQDGMLVPSKVSTEQWKELFALQSRSQRRKYLEFMFKNEMKKLGDKKKKERKKLVYQERLAKLDEENAQNDHIRYGFQGNTIFMRVYNTAINLIDNNRLIQAMKFGPDFVVDCGYDSNMSMIENKLCAKQLLFLFAENRAEREPFNVHFCNMNKSSVLYKQFYKFIPTIDDPAFPINVTEKSYLDLFPKEKLVYLTPHVRTELQEYNHDDIYIIGALVDKQNQEPLSLAKAKSQGIRMAQLPLDRYLDWGLGTKSLTINQVLNIMMTVRTTGDWVKAFNHVPQRKLQKWDNDARTPYNRGTTFRPPPRYSRHVRL